MLKKTFAAVAAAAAMTLAVGAPAHSAGYPDIWSCEPPGKDISFMAKQAGSNEDGAHRCAPGQKK